MPIPARASLPRFPLAVAAAGVIAATLAGCDSQSGPTLTPGSDSRQVTVVGAGEVQGTPDTLTVNASIEFLAPDATGAMNQTSERQKAVIDALVERRHRPQGHRHHRRSICSRSTAATAPRSRAYHATNSITVTIRDLDKASDAIGLIVSTGGNATRINSISYSIEDDSQLVQDARARAFDDAKDRAAAVRPAVRTEPGQGHLDLGVRRADAAVPDCPRRRGRWRPRCHSNRVSRPSASP